MAASDVVRLRSWAIGIIVTVILGSLSVAVSAGRIAERVDGLAREVAAIKPALDQVHANDRRITRLETIIAERDRVP